MMATDGETMAETPRDGENILSLEVEECLFRHPKIMEAAVDMHLAVLPSAFASGLGVGQGGRLSETPRPLRSMVPFVPFGHRE